ncbi:MAG: hypothetical protein HY842_01245 [Bacteroidetes bacterium]|nr:hypothetical protein [Bacteroidota bacterium]
MLNPALPTILPGWQGTPISEGGHFYHPDYPFELSWRDVLRWKTSPNPYSEQKKRGTWRPTVVKDDSFLRHTNDVMVWLGHACFSSG